MNGFESGVDIGPDLITFQAPQPAAESDPLFQSKQLSLIQPFLKLRLPHEDDLEELLCVCF